LAGVKGGGGCYMMPLFHQVDRCEAAGADDIVCEVGEEALDKI
jgi:hypothetical protein